VTRPTVILAVLASTAVGACSHDFEPPDRSERVRRAAGQYSVALFDTVSWEDGASRVTLGNTVYAERCSRCHGPLGGGDTPYAEERGLDVPSIVEPDWPLAELDSVRRRLFIGHEAGMPTYGDGPLVPREIDATAAYLLETLRPEVLGTAGRGR